MSPQNSAYAVALMCFDSENPSSLAFRGVHETLLSLISTVNLKKWEKQVVTQRRAKLGQDGRDLIYNEETDGGFGRVPVSFDHSLSSQAERAENEQLRIFASYLQVMQYVSDSKMIPADLIGKPLNRRLSMDSNFSVPLTSTPVTSRLQERVVVGLAEAMHESTSAVNYQLVMNLEVSSFNGVFPVDAAIERKVKIIALLEFDGPQHYRHDGRLSRKDLLKETLYKRTHPGSVFYRIRWDEENKFGSDLLAEELVTALVEASMKSDDFIGNTISFIKNSLSDFFGWSLRNSKDL